MADEKKRLVSTTGGLGTSLADALGASGVRLSPKAPVSTAPSPDQGPAELDLSRAAKVVLRRERKGRGGKTATVVVGLGLPPADLERVARELRRSLGCGATVDGNAIVLQGDLVVRAEPWLAARGVRRIVVGS